MEITPREHAGSTNNCGLTRAATTGVITRAGDRVNGIAALAFDVPGRDETHAEHADPREAEPPVTEERIENTGKTANWISPECRMRSKI